MIFSQSLACSKIDHYPNLLLPPPFFFFWPFFPPFSFSLFCRPLSLYPLSSPPLFLPLFSPTICPNTVASCFYLPVRLSSSRPHSDVPLLLQITFQVSPPFLTHQLFPQHRAFTTAPFFPIPPFYSLALFQLSSTNLPFFLAFYLPSSR